MSAIVDGFFSPPQASWICIIHAYVYRVISKTVVDNTNKHFLNKQGVLILSVDNVLIQIMFPAVGFF